MTEAEAPTGKLPSILTVISSVLALPFGGLALEFALSDQPSGGTGGTGMDFGGAFMLLLTAALAATGAAILSVGLIPAFFAWRRDQRLAPKVHWTLSVVYLLVWAGVIVFG